MDRDHPRIFQAILSLQRKFETTHSEALSGWIGDRDSIPQALNFVEDIALLEIKFDISQQARWLAVITLLFTPLMIGLIGLI